MVVLSTTIVFISWAQDSGQAEEVVGESSELTQNESREDLDVYIDALIQGEESDDLTELFNATLANLPSVGDYYLVEGDLPMTEADVRRHLRYLANTISEDEEERTAPEASFAVDENGNLSYWENIEERHLTYAVDRASFDTMFGDEAQEHYDLIVSNMEEASKDLEEACPESGIDYEHLEQFDGNPSHLDVDFIVDVQELGGATIATAFFPHYAIDRRYIHIDESYFTANYNLVGILRHELLHTLGFRHEHARKEVVEFIKERSISAGYNINCGFGFKLEQILFPIEAKGEVGEVDLVSATIYPCEAAGLGTRDFELSKGDIAAIKAIYGPKDREIN